MTDREKIAARIRALMAKTLENGCTEAEAVAAAELAAKLLGQYNMTLDEVEMRASPFKRHQEAHDDPVGERLWRIASAISKLTNVNYWTSRPGVRPIEINFFGFAHEVLIAEYLLEICRRAMRTEMQRLERAAALFRPAVRRMKVITFLDGMAQRLYERILALVPPKPTGTGLVVLKQALIDAAMPVKTDQRSRLGGRDTDVGYLHGYIAGGKVALNQGLGGAPAQAKGLLR